MKKKSPVYLPSMSNSVVKARTGRDWVGWFGALDKAGAARLEHKAIVGILSREYGLPGWWRQMVTVEYERTRGLRVRHETASGFSVAVSKTLATPLPVLYAATANATQRKKWFPKGAFEPSSQTKHKYMRGAWNQDARLEIGFYAKGEQKAQIALQVRKLGQKSDVERERKAWKAAVSRLQALLEG